MSYLPVYPFLMNVVAVILKTVSTLFIASQGNYVCNDGVLWDLSMLLCEQNTIRSGSWKSRRSLFCTIFLLLLFLMSAGIASADSDDEDAGDPDGDREESSDTDTDDGAEDDDNGADDIDRSNTDDESDSNKDQASEESLNTEEEPETNGSDDNSGAVESGSYDDSGTNEDGSYDDDSAADDEESDDDEPGIDDNGSDNDEPDVDDSMNKDDTSETHGSQDTEHWKNAESADGESDQKVSDPDTDEARDSEEKQTDESTKDKSKDKSNSDAGENRSPVPPGPDKHKSTDNKRSDKKSDDRVSKDNYSKADTADRNDPVPDTGSGSASSTTKDSGTTTANNHSINNSVTSNSTVKDSADTTPSDSGSSGSSSYSSATGPANSPASNLKNESSVSSNVSSNVSSTKAEDAEFLKEFRDSKEAQDNIEITDYSFEFLVKGREAVFEFGLEKNNVISISFIPEVTGGQVKTVVEILKNTSTLINEAPPGTVYKNLNIWVGDAQFSPYKTTDAKVSFKVEKDWLLSNNMDHGTIVLYGHVNGWYPLLTEKTGEDDDYVYYTAQTSGFSQFAIVSMDTYGLAEDPTAGVTSSGIIGKSGIGGSSDAEGDTDEVPYYNTYKSAALLLVSLFVAGAAGIAGLKYITSPGITGSQDEKDSRQFKK